MIEILVLAFKVLTSVVIGLVVCAVGAWIGELIRRWLR